MNDAFVHDYQELARSIEEVITQYPPEMRDELRKHAGRVLTERLQQLWRTRLRQRLLDEEWMVTNSNQA